MLGDAHSLYRHGFPEPDTGVNRSSEDSLVRAEAEYPQLLLGTKGADEVESNGKPALYAWV